jgi:glycosyltransferase involved in cell wall biosynthesis
MAKPIVTTDTPGCRSVVDDGVNGFLCAVRDPEDLAEKLVAFLSLDEAHKMQMGAASRVKAEAEFDERIVVSRYLAAIESAIDSLDIVAGKPRRRLPPPNRPEPSPSVLPKTGT